ncbi:MAG TPA: hypothetical protein DD640_10875 [Clostridiales bacterium]|nr:hypothetical protein [Clostridiales bacterium]
MRKMLSLFLIMLLGLGPGMTAGCSDSQGAGVPFQMEAIPEQLNGFSIAGQRCVFLVLITDEGEVSQTAVTITATASNAEVTIRNNQILPGQVAEIEVIPNQASAGKSVAVTITGNRGDLQKIKVITFEVIEGEDDRQENAAELLKKFTDWLETARPELGITADTEWTGTMVSPQWLVVGHYLFFSDEWEIHIAWHVMIAPDDWVRIDLRKRFAEMKPSYAFEISSLSAKDDPVAIDVPETIWR